jgi:alanyl-tRNA synthetase
MERMYWTQPDVFETEVEVVAAGEGTVRITPLLFHPDEGGQPADRGTVGDAAVMDIQVVQGQVILSLDRPLPDGRHVARLDRQHRLHTATQHTAQHILSGIAAKEFGLETVGVHIGLENCTVDFHQKLGWDLAEQLERRAMDVVLQDLPVESTLEAPDGTTRNRPGEIESDVIRVVRIGDCDVSACCGAHVARTGRIGVVRIFDIESRKSGTRVSFLAGRKALERSQAETAVLRELRTLACCANADLSSILHKTLERSKELTKELSQMWSLRLSDLAQSAEWVTVESSTVGVHVSELPRELATTLAGMIAEATHGAGIVVADGQIAVSSTTLNASDLLKRIQQHAGGKGGGSARAAAGRLDKPLTTREILEILASR